MELHLYLEVLKTMEEWVYSKMCHLEILFRVELGSIACCCLCSSAPLASKKNRMKKNLLFYPFGGENLMFLFSHYGFLLKPKPWGRNLTKNPNIYWLNENLMFLCDRSCKVCSFQNLRCSMPGCRWCWRDFSEPYYKALSYQRPTGLSSLCACVSVSAHLKLLLSGCS